MASTDAISDPNSAGYAVVVAQGYTFPGEFITIGALVQGDDATESAQVRLPLKMMNRHGLLAGSAEGFLDAVRRSAIPLVAPCLLAQTTRIGLPHVLIAY
jgi:hypothetical protein